MKKVYKTVGFVLLVIVIIATGLFCFEQLRSLSPSGLSVSNVEVKNFGGISIVEKAININGKKFMINISQIDLREHSLKMLSSASHFPAENNQSSLTNSGYTLREYQESDNYKIALSGGYLASTQPAYPLGFVKIKGKEYNRPHNSWITDSFICTNGKKIIIDRYESTSQFASWASCLQAGPLLVKDGFAVSLNDKKDPDFFRRDTTRSFICAINDNKVILGVTNPIDLYSLSAALSKTEQQSGLGCKNALLLTGGGTAGMVVKNGEKDFYGYSDALLPNVIVIE